MQKTHLYACTNKFIHLQYIIFSVIVAHVIYNRRIFTPYELNEVRLMLDCLLFLQFTCSGSWLRLHVWTKLITVYYKHYCYNKTWWSSSLWRRSYPTNIMAWSSHWENQFLYDSFGGELVLACLAGGLKPSLVLLPKQLLEEGTIKSELFKKVLSLGPPTLLESDMRRSFEFQNIHSMNIFLHLCIQTQPQCVILLL